MQTDIIQDYFSRYRQWKSRVARSVRELEGWLGVQGELTDASREHIRRALQALQENRLRIIIAGAPGRGKSELINALFFSDYGERLLGTGKSEGPGPHCPTEFFWDEGRNEAYLRLLPIETRAQDVPLGELKQDARHWVHYPLRVQDPRQVRSTLSEIQKRKRLSLGEARRLGFLDSGRNGPGGTQRIEVMKWRYALISFPQPLFKEGLNLIEIPDFRQFSQESDFGTQLLQESQSFLFVVAVDTVVTSEDREAWRRFSRMIPEKRRDEIIVVLNKNDLLWDRVQDPQAKARETAQQCARVAEAFGVAKDRILDISTRMGFQAKADQDRSLLEKSRILELEHRISISILQERYHNLSQILDTEIGQMVNHNRQRITDRIQNSRTQIAELEEMQQKSNEVIAHLIEKTQSDQEKYLKGIKLFQESREKLLAETEWIRQTLDPELIEQLLEDNHRELVEAWSTAALSEAMKRLSDEFMRATQRLFQEYDRIRRTLLRIYRRFDRELGLSLTPPEAFITDRCLAEAERVHREIEGFRTRITITFLPKATVIARYREQVTTPVRSLFDRFREDFEQSMEQSLQPIVEGIQENQRNLDIRLENLQRVKYSKEHIQERIDEAKKQYVDTAKQLTALRNINNSLRYNPLRMDASEPKPSLIAEQS